MTLERWFEMPRHWTFQMPKVRAWVEARLEGHVLNMFGGVTKLAHPQDEFLNCVWDNDIGEGIEADYHRDAYDLTEWQDLKEAFDTVVFDPPYTAFQAVHTYNGKKAQDVTHARDVVEYVLKPAGRVISLGFNSTGMSESRGFTKEALAIVNCGGSHNDILLLSEVRA